jgi:hypothetical protein
MEALQSTEITALQEQQRIRNVLERYLFAIDTRDEAAVASCFMADATAQYHKGFATEVFLKENRAIAKFLLDRTSVYSTTNHTTSNASITINGDRARAVTHAIAHVVVASPAKVLIRGLRYEDDLVRRPDGWFIRHRVHNPLWQYEADSIPPAIPVRKA